MGKATQIFLVASLIYLVIGVTIGVSLTIHPGAIGGFMAVHAHINLLGWLSMMVFAVAYHVLPRFTGKVLFSERLANTHVVLANAGLIGLMIAWPLSRFHLTPAVRTLFIAAALCYAAGAYLFVYNILRTIFGKD
ncbi:MAG: hypothetical protein IT392_00750 [Nitrospirae bacterium]|nr:hypothetical protein [Nitrospirota bacterium]